MPPPQSRIEQILQISAIAILVIGCFVVLRPFLAALVWSAIVCFATWPVYWRIEQALRGRATLAALVMTLVLIVLLLFPLVFLGFSLADTVTEVVQNVRAFLEEDFHQPPRWMASVPLFGETLQNYWREFAETSGKLTQTLKSVLAPAKDYLLKGGLAVGDGILQISLSIFISFFLYRDGQALLAALRSGMQRIVGDRTQHLLATVGGTVKSVVYGVLGTAVVQALLALLGFWVAGVPGAVLLSILTFVLSMVPMGPPLIWVPAAVWLYYRGEVGWAIFLAAYGTFVISSVDNVIKPLLISQGSNLPFVLVFLGVLGGVLAFGVVGLFIGPVLLAVGYGLVREWTAIQEQEFQAAAAGAPGAASEG